MEERPPARRARGRAGLDDARAAAGHLLTGSNYDDSQKKTTGGRNGYGAKLANIFSSEFVVETADSASGKRFKQTFKNNMMSKRYHPPQEEEA